MAETRTFSKVVLLVHPFYSFGRFGPKELREIPFERLKQNVSFVLGRWGQEVLKARRDPDCLFFLVLHSKLNQTVSGKKAEALVNKFRIFAEKELGGPKGRMLVLEDHVRPLEIRKMLAERGFVPGVKQMSGIAFGEYLGSCVREESERLAEALGFDKHKIHQAYELSSIPIHDRFNPSLGAYTQNFRKRSAQERRRQGREARRTKR